MNPLKATLLSLALQMPTYWRGRAWVLGKAFSVRKLLFGAYSETLKEKDASQVIRALAFASVWQILMAITCAALFQLSNIWIQGAGIGWSVSDEGTYATFLGTVASIAEGVPNFV